ncbi:MAG: hypothetical protein PWR30_165 [Candidatus Woesearchaeota archaeon]|nr:hypothetical protein [Candidatus Woesearchaeota archaeon]
MKDEDNENKVMDEEKNEKNNEEMTREKINEDSEENKTKKKDKEKNNNKKEVKKDRKKRIKKIIYLSIFLFIIIVGLAMLLFSIHVTKPVVSRINEYSDSTFIYELEYYLVELGFYKLHPLFQEQASLEIRTLDDQKTYSVMVQGNSIIITNTKPQKPDISIYTYREVIESLRYTNNREELVERVKNHIKWDRIVVVKHNPDWKLALKGYLSLAYLVQE